MDPLYLVGSLVLAVLAFGAGFMVAAHNARQAAEVTAAVNQAKDAITAHTTATVNAAAAGAPGGGDGPART